MPDNTSAKMKLTMKSLQNIDVHELERKLLQAGADFEPKYKVLPLNRDVMGGQYGVDETIDVVAVILVLAKAFIEGGISNYLAVLVRLPEAIIGLDMVLQEIQDLDEEDLQTIINYIITNYPSLPTEKAQLIIQHSVKAIYHIYAVIEVLIEATADPEKFGADILEGDDGMLKLQKDHFESQSDEDNKKDDGNNGDGDPD